MKKQFGFMVIKLFLVALLSCDLQRQASIPADDIMRTLSKSNQDFPNTLAETNLFKDIQAKNPQFGVIPYDVKVSLWTDGAKKQRYIFIPPEASIDVNQNEFYFPKGTVLVKTFANESDELIETRLIILQDNGEWTFATYISQNQETQLSTQPKTIEMDNGQIFRIPSQKECQLCHNQTQNSHPILGFDLRQIRASSVNLQMSFQDLQDQALFQDFDDGETDLSIPDPKDQQLSLDTRARAYLHVNCSPCHRPHGAASEENLDLRYGISIEDTGLISEQKIVPGSLEESVVWQKYTAKEERMPPLSLRQDPLGLHLITEWIKQWPH